MVDKINHYIRILVLSENMGDENCHIYGWQEWQCNSNLLSDKTFLKTSRTWPTVGSCEHIRKWLARNFFFSRLKHTVVSVLVFRAGNVPAVANAYASTCGLTNVSSLQTKCTPWIRFHNCTGTLHVELFSLKSDWQAGFKVNCYRDLLTFVYCWPVVGRDTWNTTVNLSSLSLETSAE